MREKRMETGTVKFFDSRKEKRFGFITVDGGGEIFFHFNDGETIEAAQTSLILTGGKLNREPQKGDRIHFERTRGGKGFKACPWIFSEDYSRALKELESRPAPATYRVLQQTTVYGNPPDKPKVLWEGSDMSKLCERYPRYQDRRYDDLNPTFSCSDFEHAIRFERKTETGWERCSDPRPEGPRDPRSRY